MLRCLQQPSRGLDVTFGMIAVRAPRDRLRERPEQCSFAVEFEFVAQAVEAPQHLPTPVSELGSTNDRGDTELSLTGEWLGIDREPGTTSGQQDIACVQVLVQQHLLPLRGR